MSDREVIQAMLIMLIIVFSTLFTLIVGAFFFRDYQSLKGTQENG